MPAATFGPYEFRGLLGRGGMGEVHRAFDHEQAREVALKLLPVHLASDEGFVERFRRESYAAARLNDPHVIPIHRYGEIDGRLYIDMRLVNGVDLATVIERDGPLPTARAVSLIRQAAEALDAAHAEDLIHRDVKPSNLLVTPQDFVYLVDFGIAHVMGLHTRGQALTATGATIGTLDYMAPERFLGTAEVDARADVYSLACVFYECLTGSRPFPVEGAPALMHAHLAVDPPRVTTLRPGLPAALDDVIARGMAKDPAARYPTPGALAAAAGAVRDLASGPERAVAGRPGPAPDPARSVPAAPRSGDAPPTYVPNTPSPSGSGAPWPVRATAPEVSARRGPRRTGVLIGAVAAVVLATAGGVLLGRGDLPGLGGPSASSGTPTSAAAGSGPTTESVVPATDGPVPPVAGGGIGSATPAPGPAGTVPRSVGVEPPVAGSQPVGDLGLATAISEPACDGQFVAFVGSAVDPQIYQSRVAQLLAAHPGSSYLLTAAGCSSLRARLPDGRLIYSVYLGPFATRAQACAARDQVGGDSYVKVLDDVTPDDLLLPC